MVTRIIVEVKMYILNLNNIQTNIENGTVIAISPDLEALIRFYKDELVEDAYYEDGFSTLTGSNTKWYKCFRKGGPLEWFNYVEVDGPETINYWGHGIHMLWLSIDKIREFTGIIIDPNKELDTIKTGF